MKKTNKIFSIILVFSLLISIFSVSAYAVTSGIWKYSVISENDKTISITGITDTAVTSLDIPSTIDGYTVTEIGVYAFSGYTSLESITIPDSVTSIGGDAFSGCTGLISITIPNSVTSIGGLAFYGCTGLTSITIPDSVTSIGGDAFSGCTGLTSITIPDSVKSIGSDAFYNTGYYNDTANWENNVLYISNYLVDAKSSLAGEYDIKENTKMIADCAFDSCTSLTSISIPNSVTRIGYSAFHSCTSLTSITVHENVAYIGDMAFYNCTGLTKINWNSKKIISFTSNSNIFSNAGTAGDGVELVIGESVETIPAYLCQVSSSSLNPKITSITIGENVKRIGTNAFACCTSLTRVNWNAKNVVDPSSSDTNIFSGAGISGKGVEFVFGDSVERIPEYVCYVWGIGDCNVISVIVGKNVTTIGNYAFEYCSNLKSIKIPVSVTYIGYNVFNGCTGLKDVYYGGTENDWQNVVNKSSINKGATIHYHNHSCNSNWTVDVEPTCTETGSKHNTCLDCGALVTEEIPTAEHNYVAYGLDGNHTHTITYKCSFCEDVKTETTSSLGCVECNFTIAAIDASSYKLVSYIGTEVDVVIPAAYNGCAITTVGNSCFKGNTTIKAVEFAEGVTTISSLAFMNCTALEKVTIPASVTSIGTRAFYGFTGTIYCNNGSYAHNYAITNNIKYALTDAPEQDGAIQETENTQIDYDNFVIQTSVQNINDIAQIMGVSKSAELVVEASYVYGNLELYGTGTIITVFDGNEYIGDFVLVVEGDVNGDSVCDALDAMQVGLVSNGRRTLDGAYALAADSNADALVDINDYQYIVNKVTS